MLNRQKRLVGIVALADLARAEDEDGEDAARTAIEGISQENGSSRQ